MLAGSLALVSCLDRPVSVDSDGAGDSRPPEARAALLGPLAKMDILALNVSTYAWKAALSTGTSFAEAAGFTTTQAWSDTSYIGEVNGDGKADLITRRITKEWVYRLSDGSQFQSPVSGISQFPANSTDQRLVADVSGDGLADLVVREYPTRNWFVALGSGSGFVPAPGWYSGIPSTSGSKLFAVDVTGDGKADLISVNPSNGTTFVAASTGAGFSAYTTWLGSVPSISGSQFFFADVNGNGKADLVARQISTGNWFVALSTGSGFSIAGYWRTGFAAGSNYHTMVGDVDGDGSADLVANESGTGTWHVCTANSAPQTGFGAPSVWISNFDAGANYSYLLGGNLDGN